MLGFVARLRRIAAVLTLLTLAACVGAPASTHNPYLDQHYGCGCGG
jgi:hypothetical protein